MDANETGQGERGKRRLLLTGFEPFGGDVVNPSKEIVKALDGQTIGPWEVTGAVLPVTYGVAAAEALRLIREAGRTGTGEGTPFEAVLSLGQAKGRAKICIERVAINVRDADLPDQAGYTARDEPIVPDGPAAYFSNLPLRALVSAIEKTGAPAAISNSAGAYVCNDLLYLLLHFAETAALRVGFIHLPALPEQGSPEGGVPTLSFTEMHKAIVSAVEAL